MPELKAGVAYYGAPAPLDQVAKIQAEWTQPDASKPTVICNGCYGFLQSGKA